MCVNLSQTWVHLNPVWTFTFILCYIKAANCKIVLLSIYIMPFLPVRNLFVREMYRRHTLCYIIGCAMIVIQPKLQANLPEAHEEVFFTYIWITQNELYWLNVCGIWNQLISYCRVITLHIHGIELHDINHLDIRAELFFQVTQEIWSLWSLQNFNGFPLNLIAELQCYAVFMSKLDKIWHEAHLLQTSLH